MFPSKHLRELTSLQLILAIVTTILFLPSNFLWSLTEASWWDGWTIAPYVYLSVK